MMGFLGPFFLFILALTSIGSVLYYRHKKTELIHKERMAAMEKGVAIPVFDQTSSPDPIRRYLLSGLIWLFSGAALAFFLFTLSATAPKSGGETLQEREAKVEALRKLGASDDELRRVIYEQGRLNERDRIPMGLGTVGFIPMGVGIAYLIFFSVERKRYAAVS
jgi:hypothetical protein